MDRCHKGVFVLVALLVASSGAIRLSSEAGKNGGVTYHKDASVPRLVGQVKDACLVYKDQSSCAPCKTMALSVLDEEYSGMLLKCKNAVDVVDVDDAREFVVCNELSKAIAPSGSSSYTVERDGIITEVTDRKRCTTHNSKTRGQNNFLMRFAFFDLLKEEGAQLLKEYTSPPDMSSSNKLSNFKALLRRAGKEKTADGSSTLMDKAVLTFCEAAKCCGDKRGEVAGYVANKEKEVEREMAERFPELRQEMEDRKKREEEDRLKQEQLKRQKEEQERAAREKDEQEREAARLERERKRREEEARQREEEERQRQIQRSLSSDSVGSDVGGLPPAGNDDDTQSEASEGDIGDLLGSDDEESDDDDDDDDDCDIETSEAGRLSLAKRLVDIPDNNDIAIESIKSVLKDVSHLFSCINARGEKVVPNGQLHLQDLVYVVNEDHANDEADAGVTEQDEEEAKKALPKYVEAKGLIDDLHSFVKQSGADRCLSLSALFDHDEGNLDKAFHVYAQAMYSKVLSKSDKQKILTGIDDAIRKLHRAVDHSLSILSNEKKRSGAIKDKKKAETVCNGIHGSHYGYKTSVSSAVKDVQKFAALLRAKKSKKREGALPEGSELLFKEGKLVISNADDVEARRNNFLVMRRIIYMIHAALSVLSEDKPSLSYVLFIDRDIDALFKLEAYVSKFVGSNDIAQKYTRFLKYLSRGRGSVSPSSTSSDDSAKEQLIVNVWDAGSTKSAVNMFMAVPAEGPSSYIRKGAEPKTGRIPEIVSSRESELERAEAKTYDELAKVTMKLDNADTPTTTGQLENGLDHDFSITERGMYTMPGLSSFLDCDHGCPENYMGASGRSGKWGRGSKSDYELKSSFRGAFFPKWLIENFCPTPRCPEEEEFESKSLGNPQKYYRRCLADARTETSVDTQQKLIARDCANKAVAMTSRLHLSPKSQTYRVLKQALTGRKSISGAKVCSSYAITQGGVNVEGVYNLMTLKGYVRMMWNIITTKSTLAKEAEGATAASEKIIVVSTAGMRIGMSYCPKRTKSKIHEFERYLGECAGSTLCGDSKKSEFVGYSMQNGKIEALNGWVTSNQLSKIINKSAGGDNSGDDSSAPKLNSVSKLERSDVPAIIPEEADLGQDSAIHVELGGGSAQVAYMTDQTTYEAHKSEMGAPEYLVTTSGEVEMPLYRYSLLYYGAEYAKHVQEDLADENRAVTYCFQPGLNAAQQNTAFAGIFEKFMNRDDSGCANSKSCSKFHIKPAAKDAHCCLLPAGAIRPGSAARQQHIDSTVTDPDERIAQCYNEIQTKVASKCAEQDVPAKEFNKVSDIKVKPTMMKSDGSQRDVIIAGGGMYYPMRALIRIYLCANLAIEVLNSPWKDVIESKLDEKMCFRSKPQDMQADKVAVQEVLGSDDSLMSERMDTDIYNLIDDYVKSTLAMRAELGDFADRLEEFTQPIVKVKVSTMYKMNSKFCASNNLYKAAYIMGHSSFAKQLSSVCFSNTFNMYMLTSVFGIQVAEASEDPVEVVKNNNAEVMFTMGVLRKFDNTEGPKWYPNRWSAGAAARYVSDHEMAKESKIHIEALGDPESDKAKALIEMKIGHKRSAAREVYDNDRFAETGVDYESVLGDAYGDDAVDGADNVPEESLDGSMASSEADSAPASPAKVAAPNEVFRRRSGAFSTGSRK